MFFLNEGSCPPFSITSKGQEIGERKGGEQGAASGKAAAPGISLQLWQQEDVVSPLDCGWQKKMGG